jgi:hypothetical protein
VCSISSAPIAPLKGLVFFYFFTAMNFHAFRKLAVVSGVLAWAHASMGAAGGQASGGLNSLDRMRVKELRALLSQRGVDCPVCTPCRITQELARARSLSLSFSLSV